MNAIAKNIVSIDSRTDLLPPESGEAVELIEREGRIERAQRNAYYEIGLELAAIRDRKLYKADFGTFEEYVEQRWEWERTRAYRLINAAMLARDSLLPIGNIPARESHIRPLLERLESDTERATVWQQVVTQAGGARITAKLVDEAIERHLAVKSQDWITLDKWKSLEPADRESALAYVGDRKFNEQDNNSIEWARWSWNPVTGCRHDCPYCYARDIAERFYPQKFEPSIYPSRLSAPANTQVPARAASDISYKNVFTCSMADLFGRWVPADWIAAVLGAIHRAPQWNFLLLTKFPKRMSEFAYPDNAWLGTSVDLQARVPNAEKAMASVEAGVRWLSIEPLIEPLTFKNPKLFQWVVIGGASRSTQTPAWEPPFEWIARLYCQFKDAGARVYLKDNVGFDGPNRPKGFPTWSDPDARSASDVMHYLRNAKTADQRAE